MAGFKVLVVLAIVAVCNAQLPSPDKVYALQSTMDGGLLYPRDSGSPCGLSDISFTYRLTEPYPERYHWKVTFNQLSGSYTIRPVVQSESSQFNELSYKEGATNCDTNSRLVLLQSTSGNGFIIESVGDGKCLYSYGSEVGITIWRDCSEPYTQSFAFIEL